MTERRIFTSVRGAGALLGVVLAAGACGVGATTSHVASSATLPAAATATTAPPATAPPTAASSIPTPPTTSPPTTTPPPVTPHFDTPEAAMIYLATAWNTNNITDLMHVTTPTGRAMLLGMKSEAVNLRLDHCTPRPGLGDYLCYFDHDYPPSVPATQREAGNVGHTQVLVGPATRPGWYMTVFITCG